jgi:hypothetical protein
LPHNSTAMHLFSLNPLPFSSEKLPASCYRLFSALSLLHAGYIYQATANLNQCTLTRSSLMLNLHKNASSRVSKPPEQKKAFGCHHICETSCLKAGTLMKDSMATAAWSLSAYSEIHITYLFVCNAIVIKISSKGILFT